MIITAFDVSLNRTGVCTLWDGRLHDSAVFEVSEKWTRSWKLYYIHQRAFLWLQSGNAIVAIETSESWQRASNDSRTSIEALAQARAAIMIAVERETAGIRIVEMDSHRVRELVCNNRNASKEQVQEALRMLGYELPTMKKRGRENGHYVVKTVVDPDIADAIALAYAVWSEERLRMLAKDQATP